MQIEIKDHDRDTVNKNITEFRHASYLDSWDNSESGSKFIKTISYRMEVLKHLILPLRKSYLGPRPTKYGFRPNTKPKPPLSILRGNLILLYVE